MLKRRFLIKSSLLILTAFTMSTCGISLDDPYIPLTETESNQKENDDNQNITNPSDNNIADNDKKEDVIDNNDVEPTGQVDNSKDHYKVDFIIENKLTSSESDIYRGEYLKPNKDIVNPISSQVSHDENKEYVFIGWNKEKDSSKAYRLDNLAPIVSDTTYYAKFELLNAYKLTLNFKIFDNNEDKAKNYDPSYKVELCFLKNSPTIISEEIYSLFPNYLPFDEEKNTEFVLNKIGFISDSVSSEIKSLYPYNFRYEKHNDCFALDNLPILKSDLSLDIYYNYQEVKTSVRFVVDGVETHRIDNSQKLASSYSTVGNYISRLSLGNKLRHLIPVRARDGRSYTFLGWNTNINADFGLEVTSLEESFSEGDITYYAIFSSWKYEDTFIYALPNSSSYYPVFNSSLDDLINNGSVELSNNKLTFNSEVFIKEYVNGFYDDTIYPEIHITIPHNRGIKSIANFNLPQIKSISLPSTLEVLDSSSFAGPYNDNDNNLALVINSSTKLKTIGANTFANFKNLEMLQGFTQINSIGESAFENCVNLSFENNLINFANIERRAFACTNTALYPINKQKEWKFTLGPNVRKISEEAFYQRNITSLTINEGLTSLSSRVFSYCPITSIDLPKSLSEMEGEKGRFSPFYGCSNLENLSVNPNNPVYNCYKNTISSKATKYNDETLYYGTKYAVIGSSVKVISNTAFVSSPITKIKIPKDIRKIKSGAFDDSAIKRIDYEGTAEEFLAIAENNFLVTLDHQVKIYCSNQIIVK